VKANPRVRPAEAPTHRPFFTWHRFTLCDAAQGKIKKITFICGFEVDAIGGTATVGPITVAGIVGSSMVFQGSPAPQAGPWRVKTSHRAFPQARRTRLWQIDGFQMKALSD
jgi:hypothetical protein